MPLIYYHLSIASEAAETLGSPILLDNIECYLGGAISPDAHFVGNVTRVQTHFFDLMEDNEQSGPNLMFQKHPSFQDGSELSEATRAFIVGYVCHLIVDDAWTTDIYRPFFSKNSPLHGDTPANMLDRLLQYEADRRERLDKPRLAAIRERIKRWNADMDIGIVDNTALCNWRDFVWATTVRDVNDADLRMFVQAFLVSRERVSMDEAEAFLKDMPGKIEWVVEYVGEDRLAAFRDKCIKRSIETAREYLR
ncbi:MAG: zinc dependent phospholipase C family protein [Dehalococcoidia bacterium]|jgi:hypothetical protein